MFRKRYEFHPYKFIVTVSWLTIWSVRLRRICILLWSGVLRGWPSDLEGLQCCSSFVFTSRSSAWRLWASLRVDACSPGCYHWTVRFPFTSPVLHEAQGFADRYVYTYNRCLFLMEQALYHYKMSLSLVTETSALKSLLPNICAATQLFKLTPASCFAWYFKKDSLVWAIFKVFIEFITTLFLFPCFGSLALWDLGSLTRNWTDASCIERQSLNHRTAREVPTWYFYPSFYFQPISNFEFKLCLLWAVCSQSCFLLFNPVWHLCLLIGLFNSLTFVTDSFHYTFCYWYS